MSLITRCPTCGTRFRVVPDQLKMAGGWVRCGQCAHVFDAQESLEAAPASPASPAPPGPLPQPSPPPPAALVAESAGVEIRPAGWELPVPPQEPDELPAWEDEGPPRPTAPDPAPDDGAGVFDLSEPPPEPLPEAPAESAAAPGVGQPAEPEPAWPPIEPAAAAAVVEGAGPVPGQPAADADGRREPVLDFEIPDDPPAEAAAAAEGAVATVPLGPSSPVSGDVPATAPADALPDPLPEAPAEAPAPDASTPAGAEPVPEVGFVRRARRQAFWRDPSTRLLMVLVSSLLLLVLAAQVAFRQRDELAARAPALRPLLAGLCRALDCRVGPPRDIEAVVIEGSAFTRLRPDVYRLSLTLGNQARTEVAMPSLEVTLTDSQDQPVLRRVVQPADLGPDTPAALAPSVEWSSTLTLAITPNASTSRIVGYRLLAFYP